MHNILSTEINPNFTIISENMPHLSSAALGVFFAHGSRYESKKNQGISHLIEHMLFKGTKKKSAKDISIIIESAGAILDGFTSKETCGIYTRYFADNFDVIMDLLSEIVSSSKFDAGDLEKEKNVIEQEITESLEDPREHVFTLLFEILFPEHPLSYPTVGTVRTIQSITRNDLVDYYYNKILPSKVCISAAGKVNHDQVVEKFSKKKYVLYAKAPPVTQSPKIDIARVVIVQNRPDLTQIHVVAAELTFSYKDDRRYGLTVMNNILGGTMSSRLFQRLREKEGLVYTVSSIIDLYSDIGVLGAYYVTDVKNFQRVTTAGLEEAMKLKQSGITQKEFERTINFCKGMSAIGAENPMSRMIRNANNQLLLEKVIPIEESIAAYNRLTIDDINNLTAEIKPTEYSAAIIGQVSQIEPFMKQARGSSSVIVKK